MNLNEGDIKAIILMTVFAPILIPIGIVMTTYDWIKSKVGPPETQCETSTPSIYNATET